MPKLRIKVDCHISANCQDEEEHDLDDEEWSEYQRAKQSDRAQEWVAENLIEPEMLHPAIIIREEGEDD